MTKIHPQKMVLLQFTFIIRSVESQGSIKLITNMPEIQDPLTSFSFLHLLNTLSAGNIV